MTVTWSASIESSDTAVAADFVDLSAATATVEIAPGRDAVGQSVVAEHVFDDALDEDDETFTLTLSAVNATVGAVGNAGATGTMTIEDDDPTPTVTVADAAASEGGNVAFVATLSAVSGRDVDGGLRDVGGGPARRRRLGHGLHGGERHADHPGGRQHRHRDGGGADGERTTRRRTTRPSR